MPAKTAAPASKSDPTNSLFSLVVKEDTKLVRKPGHGRSAAANPFMGALTGLDDGKVRNIKPVGTGKAVTLLGQLRVAAKAAGFSPRVNLLNAAGTVVAKPADAVSFDFTLGKLITRPRTAK